MRAGRTVFVAVSTMAALLVAPQAHAQAGTLYVNQIPACSDSGAGTATTPYCTLQKAVDVVQPGQTIQVGIIQQTAVITRSGTESAPIVITGDEVRRPADTGGPLITVDGAAHVVLRDIVVETGTNSYAVLVDGASHVTVDRLHSAATGLAGSGGVRVTDATDVVVSRSTLNVRGRPAHVTGGTRVTVTGNLMELYSSLGVLVEDSTDAAITGNNIPGKCWEGIAVTGASTASVQNNVVIDPSRGLTCPDMPHAIAVDAAAAPGTTVDYNIATGGQPYEWAGTVYASAAELFAATGQGAHDSKVHPDSSDSELDSGNADAPGVLDPAVNGPRVDDPRTANTGGGAHTYLDRGAREAQDWFSRRIKSISASRAPVGGEVSVLSDIATGWGLPVDCTVDFGDGTTTSSCSAAHAYAAPGTYTVKHHATTPSKLVTDTTWQVTVVPGGGSMKPTMTVNRYGGVSASFDVDLGPDYPWNPKSVVFDFGDGDTWTTEGALSAAQNYDRAGTYTVTARITDASGATATASATFTTHAAGFVKYGPTRFLDTRSGLGIGGTARKVAPNGTVRLAVGGQRGIPANATAVIVNVTATNPSASGFVAVHPDGSPRPATSTLNYTAGRTVSNPTTVALGTGGYLDLYNGSGGTTDLIADVLGYYVRSQAGDGLTNLSPNPVLDTRTGIGQEAGVPAVIPAGGTASPPVTSEFPSNLAPAFATSVVLNVTVVNPRSSGYITAYPTGATRPTASNVNFVAGETIAKAVTVPVGQGGRVSFYTPATTDLLVTIVGYYAQFGDGYFIPVTPEREVDTRTGGGPVAPRTDVIYPLHENASLPQLNLIPDTVVSNVTVVNAQRSGYLTAYAIVRPVESTLNFTAGGGPVSNMALTGNWRGFFHNGSDGNIDLLVDVTGYFFTA